ncbi:MAG: ABC-2 type transport system ATP-binding protein [Actinomycetes bacterium]|jgi:ABC-2 type transport system ATP-binding protein
MATNHAIVAEGLTKSYGDVHAVRGVDLEIATGECFAMLGPNGAGKTTCTEIFEGFRSRTSGRVEVLGQDPAKAPRSWKARLGIVLQTSRDLTDLTVAESVDHFAAYYPDARDPAEVIDAVGLSAKARVRSTALSGGQRRRLDVALGIIGKPEVLFLDEPTTGFDPEARRQFWDLIDGLKDDGTTILLTTHYMEEAEALADRVAVLAQGRVVACDSPERLSGRQDDSAHVSWLSPDGPKSIQTSTPTQTVSELAAQFGGEVPELAVMRPSLEDIYLKLIEHDEALATADTPTAEELGK